MDRYPTLSVVAFLGGALILAFASVCSGQDDTSLTVDFDSEEAKEARLEYTMGHVKALTGSFDGKKGTVTPMEQPLLRWTNPYSNVKDGFLVGWVDDNKRPVAVGQFYLLPGREDQWGIETQSLAQKPFRIESKTNGPWRPRKPGINWATVPKPPKSTAGTKPLRLSQMRSIARRFRADDDFDDEESELRLLTNPVYRYAHPDSGLIDGAVFALVHGTDPELIISIELRQDSKSKSQSYFYALAPMTGYALRCRLDNAEVWNKPRTTSARETDVFWQRNVSDVPRSNLFRQLLGF